MDQVLSDIDRGLRTVFVKQNSTLGPAEKIDNQQTAYKDLSGEDFSEGALSDKSKKQSARLMRVNHAGEIAAQGLYHGHFLTAHDEKVKQQLHHSAAEEEDHLAWCNERLEELDAQPSMLSPLWYASSYAIGASVGLLGDKWILGFISETEKQVVKHLDKHLARLPEDDHRSRKIIHKMREEEAMHDQTARDAGAEELPQVVKLAMHAISKIMTKTSYWV